MTKLFKETLDMERFQVTLEFGEENTASSLTTIVSHVIEMNGHKSRIIAKFMY